MLALDGHRCGRCAPLGEHRPNGRVDGGLPIGVGHELAGPADPEARGKRGRSASRDEKGEHEGSDGLHEESVRWGCDSDSFDPFHPFTFFRDGYGPSIGIWIGHYVFTGVEQRSGNSSKSPASEAASAEPVSLAMARHSALVSNDMKNELIDATKLN
ncbi:MAG: hypothetical protein F2754_14560 [Actinobacteria bacterium]|nr:hypothetical protein [Actinomycetota bacterium]MSW92739.1 hypothetical protein [Actinomycetota bacterium]MSX88600.1 hypothetical protein [Actinomycetota bacterium]MSY73539.1 hypothetical protein [Actinomycetota bacterium]